MPEYLKEFLKALNPEQTDQLSLWLDSTPEAIDEMIEILESKPS